MWIDQGEIMLEQSGTFYEVVKHWNRFIREEVDAPFLETFSVRLGSEECDLHM